MSNTSNNKAANSKPTKSKDKDKLRVIVGEIGRDSKTGILGRGYSPDNGKTFHVTETMYGRLYNGNDIDAIWNNGTSEKVKSEVNSATAEIPAVKSAADEAVKKADSAIASSKVNSDAIVAQSEAISEAKAAMDSATAEIQQTASNAASDAAKIRADLAQVQNEVDTAKAANSASVEALKSDVSAAKQDLADVHDSLTKAQAAAEESQKAIDKSIAKINSDIEQDRKDIASAQQANDDTAKQLDTYSKQAQDQGKTIKSIQDKQDGFTATLADVQGNVTQVSDKVDGLSASLKDAQDNVASIKAQADQLSATLTDHAKSIATLTASANELSSTLEDADGRLSKVEQTAQTNSSTLSDVQGDLSQVKQDASTLTATLKDAQGNISTLQQKADSVSAQLASAQGDIASLQTDVTGIKATLVSHEGDIHTLQADSKSLHDSMQDAQGDISTLKKTSTDVTSELKDHDGRMSKVEQTASTLTNEFSDQQGRLNKVEQTAQGTQQTVANQQGQINSIQTDVSGIHETITGQGNQIATINTSLNGLNTKYESVSGDLGKLSDKVTTNSTQITQNKKEIDLKADQTEVDQVKQTASQNSSRLDVMVGQISSKVTATDVNNIVDKKGYATTSTVQSLITQKAGTINESITNLTNEVNTRNGVNLLKGTADFSGSDWFNVSDNGWSEQKDWRPTDSDNSKVWHKSGWAWNGLGQTIYLEKGDYTFSMWLWPNLSAGQSLTIYAGDSQYHGTAKINSRGFNYSASQAQHTWIKAKYYFTVTTAGNVAIRPELNQDGGEMYVSEYKLEKGYVEDPVWTPAPSDNATVTQIQSITSSIDGLQSTVANKADKSQITQLSNVIQSKVSTSDFTSKVSQLSNDINARVSKGDLMSQINLEAGQTLIESKKLFLDADSVVFSGKAFIPDAAIENLSLDKLTTGSLKVPLADDNGNAISLDESGITINSALSPVTWIPFYGKSDDQSGFYLSLSSKGMKFVNHFVYGKDTQKQIGAKSDDYTFMDIQPDVLHYRDGSTDNVNIPSGLTIYVPQETSSSLGPASPGGFFAMGYKNSGSALHGQDIKKGVEIAYVSKEINGWLEGFHVETNMFVHPRGADHGIRFAWVSWSAWDFGERYPAIVNDTANWGGVAFPKSGAVTLFNATGKYYTPYKDTGHGTYSDYQ